MDSFELDQEALLQQQPVFKLMILSDSRLALLFMTEYGALVVVWDNESFFAIEEKNKHKFGDENGFLKPMLVTFEAMMLKDSDGATGEEAGIEHEFKTLLFNLLRSSKFQVANKGNILRTLSLIVTISTKLKGVCVIFQF
ncbi:unnamed protein product [Arabis nemorensis]|uniref:Uncharacterized protein n=1 Tax=Arabis nemorensis TaxID=586526 RepID=A0A565AWM2_9BRAS|nr:unnamed protein product [Arabis nemorensis]